MERYSAQTKELARYDICIAQRCLTFFHIVGVHRSESRACLKMAGNKHFVTAVLGYSLTTYFELPTSMHNLDASLQELFPTTIGDTKNCT